MSKSVWLGTTSQKNFPSLDGDIEVDVAVVGGGITGIVAAYFLVKEGRRVAVIDLGQPGTGETGHTTAHLTEQVDARYDAIRTRQGEEAARLVAGAGRLAIDRIASIAVNERIECAFEETRAFLYTDDATELDDLRREAEAAASAGIAAAFTTEVPLPYEVAGAIVFERQAQFHPLRFLHGVSEAIVRHGGSIYGSTRALSVDDGSPAIVRTDRGTIRAREVLVTANVPVNQRGILQTKLPAYRSYAITAPIERPIERALFWDTEDPYHYVRTHREGAETFLIVGGEDHKTGEEIETARRFDALETWMRARFEAGAIRYRWSGQIIEPPDGLPYIGRNGFTEHIWVATGYSGQGMTFGTFAGTMLADLVRGAASPWKDVFDPIRLPSLETIGTYVSENLDYPKHLISDRLTSRAVEASGLEEIAEGDGKIVEIEGKKIAASRVAGELLLLSTICPHLGCDVRWNVAERSWDCPCHGSRFAPDGSVLNGPASKELKPVEIGGEENARRR